MGRKRRAQDGPEGLPSDMEDEIDTFAKAKDKVALNVSDKEDEGDTSEEEAVLDLQDSSDEEEEDEESMDDDEGEESELEEIGLDELEKDIQEGGEIGELAEQAKAARQMLMRAKGAEDSSSGEEEEEGDEEIPVMQWGGARQFYGTADGKEADMGDEELEEEAEEVLKLQKQQLRTLEEKDFDIGASDDDGDSEQEEEEEGPGSKSQAGFGSKEAGTTVDPEKMALLIKQSPELVALCADLKESLTEIRTKIGPLVKEAREGGLCENEGLSYLEVKHHLLLHYCICIMFYLLMKVEGKPVKDHPVILRLIEIRAFLEKIRPIDARLQYQVDKVLRAAQIAKNAENGEENLTQEEEDALQFAPRPDALVTEGEVGLENDGGVYKVPKLNPVAMEEDMEAANEQRRRVEERKRAAQSDLVNEMVQELTGAPEEVRDHTPGWDTAKAIRALKKMEERSKIEEEMFTRVAFTKEEKKRFKAHKHRAGMSGGMVMGDFADDIRHTLNAIGGTRSSQHFDTGTIPQKGRPKSGDADLPMKDSFKERKKLFDQIKMRKMERSRRPAPTEEEEEARMAARQAKQDKIARIQAVKEKRRQTKPPSAVPTVDGPRGISTDIQKNRGLTPHRRRDIKNPRKRQRLRYETAQTKRSGAVQKQREDKEHYGGEATGIKKNIAKSVRFR